MSALSSLAIGWQVGVPSGWGTYGLNLAVNLAREGIAPVLPLLGERLDIAFAEDGILLQDAANAHRDIFRQVNGPQGWDAGVPVLKGLGDGLDVPDFLDRMRGTPDIGIVFFESATVPPDNLARARRDFALIVAGSEWNRQVLADAGLEACVYCPQGIDPRLFRVPDSRPAPPARPGVLKDRFVIFSGGKFEYRKGQDLVLAAFKRFHARHPEALLLTAWTNLWPQSIASMGASSHVQGVPEVVTEGPERGRLKLGPWLAANGIDPAAVFDVGPMANAAMPDILAHADLALFPNRCEGGTNLVAMEAMACGVPSVIARNTGQADLLPDVTAGETPTAYALDLQLPMGELTGRPEWQGWGESAVDELVSRMETAFGDAQGRAAIGAAGAAFMAGWGWGTQTRRLVAEIEKVL